jgi:hypothetical protein
MRNRKLEIGFGEYDRTCIMADGTIKIDGVDASFHCYRIVTDVFEAMIRQRAFDVAELGMSYFCALWIFIIRRFSRYICSRTVVSGTRPTRNLKSPRRFQADQC